MQTISLRFRVHTRQSSFLEIKKVNLFGQKSKWIKSMRLELGSETGSELQGCKLAVRFKAEKRDWKHQIAAYAVRSTDEDLCFDL